MRLSRISLRPAFIGLALPLVAQTPAVPLSQLAAARSAFACQATATQAFLVGGSVPNGETSLPCASTEVLDLASGLSQPRAALTRSRSGHALVRLKDGSLLAVGGEGQVNGTPGPNPGIVPPLYGPLATAERYWPAEDRWEAVGTMARARADVAAARAADGRVLVVGDGRETEWFNPANGAFTPGPILAQNHPDAILLALPDGHLLVLGSGSARPELVDPRTGHVRQLPALSRLRSDRFTATPLPGGDVLIVGGDADKTHGATAERWSLATRASQLLPHTLITDRREHTATLLGDGRLLLVGGRGITNRVPDGAVSAVPPMDGFLGSVESLDIRTGRSTTVGFLTTPRAGHGAQAYQDEALLIFGGMSLEGPLASVERLNLR